MKSTLAILKLLLGQFQTMRFTQQPFAQFVWQRRAVVAGQFAASEPLGECTVVNLVPTANGNKQFAHAVAVLHDFLLQLSAIANQMTRRFIL